MVMRSAIFLAFLAPATCLVVRQRRLVAQRSPTQPHRRFATEHSPTQRRATTDDYAGDDYLISDSLDLRERPSLATALANPRDLLALALLAVGAAVSAENVAGRYGEAYVATEVAAVALGAASAAAAFAQVATAYNISPNRRRGIVDDATVTAFAGAYSLAVSWLALRASEACPPGLGGLDGVCAPLALGVFAYGAAAPVYTLVGPPSASRPPLSPTEALRARGLVAIGALGAVFAPDCVAFALGSDAWWDRVAALHPSQRALESSTSLFALFATEASMVAHRAGKAGCAPFERIVPAFVGVCFVLAVAPCAAALYWLGSDVSFFSFYRD